MESKPTHDFWGSLDQVPDVEIARLCRLLDEEAAVEQFADARRRLLNSIGVKPGSVLVDLGSGPACHLEQTTGRLGSWGRWICVDRTPGFIVEASSRLAKVNGNHLAMIGDVRKVPLPDGIADCVLADKLMIHVGPIGQVASEMARLVRSGGWVGSCDAEADATFVHSSDLVLTRRIMRFWADMRPTPNAAAAAAEAFSRAGLTDIRRLAITVTLTEPAEPFFSHVVSHWANRAAAFGVISTVECAHWVDDVIGKATLGAALIAIPMIITLARKP
jgi:ubiquinone/menaquinone biosynthesis C-methylase UbiE